MVLLKLGNIKLNSTHVLQLGIQRQQEQQRTRRSHDAQFKVENEQLRFSPQRSAIHEAQDRM